jgi:DNA replication protein DnaC
MTTVDLSKLSLPPELIGDLRLAAKMGKPVFRRAIELRPGECPNCGGMGFLWLAFADGDPLPSPARRQKSVYTYADGGWWAVENRFYPCPVCRGREQRIEDIFQRSGLEESERLWSLDFITGLKGKEQAVRTGQRLLASLPKPAGWLVFHGDFGVGKSGVLRSIVAGCCREMVPARYVRAEDILRELRATFGNDSEVSEDALMDGYGRYQVLAIDEVDRVSDTKWSRSALFTLLDTRYKRREQLATLLATNCDPTHMPDGFEYLQSRMQHGERIEMTGKDLRQCA